MKKIKIDVYEHEIHAFNSYDSFNKYCKKNGYVHSGDDLVFDNSIGCVGVFGKEHSSHGELYMIIESNDISVIVHESVHASMFILENVGVSFTFQEQEPLAYLTGYIFKSFCKAFNVLPKDKLTHE